MPSGCCVVHACAAGPSHASPGTLLQRLDVAPAGLIPWDVVVVHGTTLLVSMHKRGCARAGLGPVLVALRATTACLPALAPSGRLLLMRAHRTLKPPKPPKYQPQPRSGSSSRGKAAADARTGNASSSSSGSAGATTAVAGSSAAHAAAAAAAVGGAGQDDDDNGRWEAEAQRWLDAHPGCGFICTIENAAAPLPPAPAALPAPPRPRAFPLPLWMDHANMLCVDE